MALVVMGLGNPGARYQQTRHNAGWILLDHVARQAGIDSYDSSRFGLSASARIAGTAVKLVKPTSYMNRSGEALRWLRSPDWDPVSELLVLVDEAALPLGSFRLRASGSAGGHNGLRSIEAELGSRDYARLRIGVGPKPEEYDNLADFVLGRFRPDERETLLGELDRMAEAVTCWAGDGIEAAMNRFNRS